MSSYAQRKNLEKSNCWRKGQGSYLSSWGWRFLKDSWPPAVVPHLTLSIFLQRKMLSHSIFSRKAQKYSYFIWIKEPRVSVPCRIMLNLLSSFHSKSSSGCLPRLKTLEWLQWKQGRPKHPYLLCKTQRQVSHGTFNYFWNGKYRTDFICQF